MANAMRQLDPGIYTVWENTVQKGAVYVEPGSKVGETIESWALYPTYAAPAMAAGEAAHDLVVRAAVLSDLSASAEALCPEGVHSEADFLAIMRVEQQGFAKKFRYIRAVCDNRIGLPAAP